MRKKTLYRIISNEHFSAPVTVGGQTVSIRGSVINGVPLLGKMYIP